MASAIRQGRKGGKVASSPAVAPRTLTPGSVMSPMSLQANGGECTTIISDPNAAHPFDPDAILSFVKKPPTGDANPIQFDLGDIQQFGKGVMIGKTKQVRTTTRDPQVKKVEALAKLKIALEEQEKKKLSSSSPPTDLGIEKLTDHNVVVVPKCQNALSLAVTLCESVPNAKILVVVPKYFEVSTVRNHLVSLIDDDENAMVGEFCGQTFEGTKATHLWVTSAEMALLYLENLHDIAPFTHVVIPGFLDSTQLLSCFVSRFSSWMINGVNQRSSPSVRVILTSKRDQSGEVEMKGLFQGLKTAFIEGGEDHATKFSYAETCALTEKEMMVMEKNGDGSFSAPTKRLTDYTAQIAADVLQCIRKGSNKMQVIVIFTGNTREVLTALQEAHLDDCAVYSGFQREEITGTKHRVHVMNHMRQFLDIDDDYTVVIDMGTIRRASAEHKSESFIAASTTEWITKKECAERLSIVDGKSGCCYFALYPDDVSLMFLDDVKTAPDMLSGEDALVHCARVGLSMDELAALFPTIPSETVEQVLQTLSEKCMIANPQNLAITFMGEMTARLPVDSDIASFIIRGCNIGLGEAALIIGSVAAMPFRPLTPPAYSSSQWNDCTRQSREKYGSDISSQSDLLADALVFIQWLKRRARGECTVEFMNEILVQESKLKNIEGLMKYMREQLTNYIFLDQFDTPERLENVVTSIRENSAILLFLESVALARRAAFVRDAGQINDKDRYATMVFIRTAKRLLPHNYIPSSIKWETNRVLVPVILKNHHHILGGLFSLIKTSYFFTSLLLISPYVEYSAPLTTDKGNFVYFGVSYNRQMKRFVVLVEDAAQILDFREKMNLALGCMQALRTLPQPMSRIKFTLMLKKHCPTMDLEHLQKDIRRQFHDLVTELNVTEYQGSFETYMTHYTAPKELFPVSNIPAMDVALLRRFADGTLWETTACPPNCGAVPGGGGSVLEAPSVLSAANPSTAVATHNNHYDDDDDDDVEFIEESFFMRHGPIIEDEDDD